MKDPIFHGDTYFAYGFKREPNYPLEFRFEGLYTFIYISEGELVVDFAQGTLRVQAGEMVFLPMQVPREFSVGDCELMVGRLFCFRYWPGHDELDYSFQTMRLDEEQKDCFYAIQALAQNPEIDCKYIRNAYRFLAKIEPLMHRNSGKHFENIHRVWEYMKANNSYTIPDLVKISGMSKSRFYDAFLKITGRTPIEIKHQIQAYKAEFLLKNTDLTVEDITHRVGYYSVANFRKMFLSRYQATNLREYRKQAKEE